MTAEKNTTRGKKTKGKTKETCKRGGDHRRPGGAKGRHRRPRKQSKRQEDQGETKEDHGERLIDDQENPYKMGKPRKTIRRSRKTEGRPKGDQYFLDALMLDASKS